MFTVSKTMEAKVLLKSGSKRVMESGNDDWALALQLQQDLDAESDDFSEEYSDTQKSSDLILAKELQATFDQELNVNKSLVFQSTTSKQLNASSIVDASWELIDPNPNIHSLFLTFNEAYFDNKLIGIEVKWSPRMTLCAGLCCYEGRGGLCSVRLSLPLLKLRPRRDLVETLLHEMIHAYLFITANNKDHDAHGPEFHKHMNRINQIAKTKISVYHTFREEVASYQQHWWRCNGPCHKKGPFWGYVKRSMNRAPSKNDTWWSQHQASCHGTFIKIKEPEPKPKKGAIKRKSTDSSSSTVTKDSNSPDIRNFFSSKKDSVPSMISLNSNPISGPSSSKILAPYTSTASHKPPMQSTIHTISGPIKPATYSRVSVPNFKAIIHTVNSKTTQVGINMKGSSTVSVMTKNSKNVESENIPPNKKMNVFESFTGKGHILGSRK